MTDIFLNGQYLVIKIFPRSLSLEVVFKGFDLQKARHKQFMEEMATDYSTFAIRMYFQGKLYKVNNDGTRGKLSLQQNWRIHHYYLHMHHKSSEDGGILTCRCSYPYFTFLVLESHLGNYRAGSQTMTCLGNDNGHDILNCPNCGSSLPFRRQAIIAEDEEEDEQYLIPATCNGCTNYHGGFYGNNQLICAIHPSGAEDKHCPDYTK